ncbi:MAG: peptidoglycan DD-metalloendopeptidase family protein [Candidatus Omnitrophica bacterium]|nr:peptidoglycan DD-metalloendopeptidase family protein [Candidatus Omnitrophota bacterium]
MYIILFSSLIFIFVSCAPATIPNQPCPASEVSKSNYQEYDITTSSLHFIWPVRGKVVNGYGANINHISNKGINIKASQQDTVVASESGQVAFANHIKGWGKTLIIQHPKSFYTIYANLDDIKVKEGFSVKRGDSVGHVAQLASNKEGVLHFEIRRKHLADNPLRYLKAN